MTLCSTVGLGDPSRKRMAVVVLCAVAHLLVTVLLVSVFLGAPWEGSAPFSEYLRRYTLNGLQGRDLTMVRQAAIELRRQSAPLTLIRRVKDIEAEVAKSSQVQVSTKGGEQEEEQEQLATEQQGEPAIEDDEQGVIERAIPPEKCYPERNTDFAGDAVRWGLTYHVNSAAECCNACSRQAAFAKPGQRKCNVWVFCPESKGCPSPDGYEHKFGECWLKQAGQPRAYVNDYSILLRDMPPMPVLWISGVIPFNGG